VRASCDSELSDLGLRADEQPSRDGEQHRGAVGRGAEGARSGGLREVAIAETQHDRAAHPVPIAEAAGEPIDDLGEDEVQFVDRARAAAERTLRADGAASARGVNRARVP
jgi:hypothetical protein